MSTTDLSWQDAAMCVTNDGARDAHHAAQVELDSHSSAQDRAARWDAIQRAKEACLFCPVILQCRQLGYEINSDADVRLHAGIYGGISFDAVSDSRPGVFKGNDRDCPKCGALKGYHCTDATGAETMRTHSVRTYKGHECAGDDCTTVILTRQRKRCDPCKKRLEVARITAYRARRDNEAASVA